MSFRRKFLIYICVAAFGAVTLLLSPQVQACEPHPKTKSKIAGKAKHSKKLASKSKKSSKLAKNGKFRSPSKVRIIDTGARPAPVVSQSTYSKANMIDMHNNYVNDLERPVEDFLTPHEAEAGTEN